jgi:hypothetical protein
MPASGKGGYWALSWSYGVNATTGEGVYEYNLNSTPGLVITPSYTSTMKSVSSAISDLPQNLAQNQLDPQTRAAAANALWKYASSQPGYEGLPYDASQPITSTDVSNNSISNPAIAPTLNDYVSPAINPASPASAPLTSTDPSANTIPASSTTPQVNLGADPGIVSPTLEDTPTAQSILDPILTLMPDLKNYVVPSHSGVCPSGSVDIFGHVLVMDEQCTLAETIRPTLYAVMAFVWLFISIVIILSA